MRGRGLRERPDVLIVGGGVIALSTAEALSSEGLSIRLIEAETTGSGASGAAAGMLAPISEADLASPLLPLGLESLRRFEPLCARLREETGIDPEFVASGLVHLAAAGSDVPALEDRFRRTVAAAQDERWSVSPDLEWLDPADLLEMEGPLAPGWTAGFFSPRESHLRPPLFVRALEAAARYRGVRIDSGVRAHRLIAVGDRIVGVESSAGTIEAGTTIVAAGAWTPSIFEASRIDCAACDIEPVRGQILCLEGPLPSLRSIVWASDVYFVPKRDGSWIVGATEERVGFDRRVTAAGVAWLIDRACEVFPALAEASFSQAWAGLRPVRAGGMPMVGRVPNFEHLFVAAGHGRNGVLLAPITAQLVVDELLGKGASAHAFG